MEWGGTDKQLFQRFSSSACKSRAVKILLLIVRTPDCEPDAFRIQVTATDAVLICSLYNLKELKSKPQTPSHLTLKMRTISLLFVFSFAMNSYVIPGYCIL